MNLFAGLFYADLRPVSAPEQVMALEALSGYVPVYQARGLWIASLQDGASPEVPVDMAESRAGSLCVWDGRLHNRRELVSALQESGLNQNLDSLIALAVYESKSIAGLRDLIGDWSLALFDALRGVCILASDFAGVRPLYFCEMPGGLMWSSSLEDLGVGPVATNWTRSTPRRS